MKKRRKKKNKKNGLQTLTCGSSIKPVSRDASKRFLSLRARTFEGIITGCLAREETKFLAPRRESPSIVIVTVTMIGPSSQALVAPPRRLRGRSQPQRQIALGFPRRKRRRVLPSVWAGEIVPPRGIRGGLGNDWRPDVNPLGTRNFPRDPVLVGRKSSPVVQGIHRARILRRNDGSDVVAVRAARVEIRGIPDRGPGET